MSGGASSLAGYIYQQRYLAFRVLSSVAAGHLPGYPAQMKIKEFTVEGRDGPTGPAWDVGFCLEDDSVHLRECKDTPITRWDRCDFYRRVRQELGAGTAASRLTVGWVTDPDKQGNILDHFSAPQWSDRVAALPDTKFLEGDGRLHAIVTAYETEMAR
jgi:hypothetical protein